MKKTYEPHTSSLGNLGANLIAMAVYLVVLILGGPIGIVAAVILYFAIEKNSGLVKFSVAQSLLLLAFYSVARGVVNVLNGGRLFSWFGIGFIRTLVNAAGSVVWALATVALMLLYLALMIKCAVSAYRYEEWEAPFVGGLARKLMDSTGEKAAYEGNGPVPPQAQPYVAPQGPAQPYWPGQQPGAAQQPPVQPGFDQYGQPVVPGGAPGQQPPAAQPYAPQAGAAPAQPYQQPTSNAPVQQPAAPYSNANDQLPPDMRDPQ